MNKILVFVASVAGATLAAALFGALHDQITYSLSPEYYTLLKFPLFGVDTSQLPDRYKAGLVGFRATWWVGTGLGLILATVALVQKNAIQMAHAVVLSLIIVVATALVAAVLGGMYWRDIAGTLYLPLWAPEGVNNPDAFYQVGMIHDFSYLGGALGGFVALVYSLVLRFRQGL